MKFQQKPSLGTPINRKHPLARGLVGCWIFNEKAGDTAFDLSGNGNDGTLTNMAVADAASGWGTIKSGEGIKFDGINDLINLHSKASLDDINPISICTELYANSYADDNRIYTKDATGAAGKTLCIREAPDNILEYRSAYSVTRGQWSSPTNSILTGNLYRTCVTHDNSSIANDAVIYINGLSVTVNETSVPNGTIVSEAAIDGIIGNRPDTARSWDGMIGYLFIYNRILSPFEVAWINRDPYAMFQPSISPELMYYEAPGGVSPTGVFYGPLVGPLGGPI